MINPRRTSNSDHLALCFVAGQIKMFAKGQIDASQRKHNSKGDHHD
jgi:hypothetical protein